MLKAVDEARRRTAANALVRVPRQLRSGNARRLSRSISTDLSCTSRRRKANGDLINGAETRSAAYSTATHNLGMRHLNAYIPSYPVGTAEEVADMIAEFVPITRAVTGVKDLKIITFGPRPQDFFACNAPIKGLYMN